MKNVIIATALTLGIASSAWAVESVDIHAQVNNAQAFAHQKQSTASVDNINGSEMNMGMMNQHQSAIVAHETMNNAHANVHEQMVQSHKRMMGQQDDGASGTPQTLAFSQMNEHEQAAIAHETISNGQSIAHQQLAAKHRQQARAH